jgi:hypothetical protein
MLDAIEYEPTTRDGLDDLSESDDPAQSARSPTSPRKPRHTHRERARTLAGGGHQGGREVVDHVFQVITPQRTFRLCAPSEEEEIKWLAALRTLINRERGVISPTIMLAPSLPLSVGTPGGGYGLKISHSQSQAQAQAQQVPTPSIHSGFQEGSYFAQTPGVGSEMSSSQVSGFSFPSIPKQYTMGDNFAQGGAARPVPANLPPLVTTPSASAHTRTRSATQSAKAAVAEVVRRFNPDSPAA